MSVDVIRSDDSMADVENIIGHFLDHHLPATALRFSRAVQQTLELLAVLPEIGSAWESKKTRLQNVRFENVRGFRDYLIFYKLIEAGLYVERIVDGRRDLERIL